MSLQVQLLLETKSDAETILTRRINDNTVVTDLLVLTCGKVMFRL